MTVVSRNNPGNVRLLRSVERRFSFAPHRHDEMVIALYLGGRKAYRCHHTGGLARGGDLLVIAPDVVHAASTIGDTPWDYVAAYIPLRAVAGSLSITEADCLSRIGSHRHFASEAIEPGLIRRFLNAISGAQKIDLLALQELLVAVFAAGPPETDEPPRRRDAILDRIAARLRAECDSRPALSDLSEEAGMSPEHLCRRFKAQFGLTPFQHLIAARVERSRDLLRAGHSIAAAAVAAGFADQSHMTRWFHRVYGITPGRFIADQ
jgi:AraC family transcriptional regulator, chemosensory pili system protein ChpD